MWPVIWCGTGSVPVPVKGKLLIPVQVLVTILIPVVSRFEIDVVLYKALDILCDLLGGKFNLGAMW